MIYKYIYIYTYMASLQNVCSFCSSSSSFLRHIKGDLPRLYTHCSPCSGGGFRRSGRCCHRRHACQSDRSSRSPGSKNPTTQSADGTESSHPWPILDGMPHQMKLRLKHSEASGFFCMSSSIGTGDVFFFFFFGCKNCCALGLQS